MAGTAGTVDIEKAVDVRALTVASCIVDSENEFLGPPEEAEAQDDPSQVGPRMSREH